MNTLKKVIVGFALSLGITLNVSAQTEKEIITGKTAPEIVKLMGTGWNLGNTLDANSRPGTDAELSWGNPKTTQEMIDEVKKAGFNTIRIPVSWGTHTDYSDDMDFKIEEEWLARIKEVVDYCFNNNMYVILNIHHDTNKDYYYPSTTEKPVSSRRPTAHSTFAENKEDSHEKVSQHIDIRHASLCRYKLYLYFGYVCRSSVRLRNIGLMQIQRQASLP